MIGAPSSSELLNTLNASLKGVIGGASKKKEAEDVPAFFFDSRRRSCIFFVLRINEGKPINLFFNKSNIKMCACQKKLGLMEKIYNR